jgi:uncharacterized protein (TIGR03083 family)
VQTLAPSSRCHPIAVAEALELLDGEIRRMARLAMTVDPATPVPGCPGWDFAQLLEHTGRTHRWIARIVGERHLTRLDPRTVELGLPAEWADRPGWFTRGGDLLVETLSAVDPETPMYSWAGDPHARFWVRRALAETTIHRVDAEAANGVTGSIDLPVAADLIDEFLEVLPYAKPFRPKVRDLHGDGETIHLHATDPTVLEPPGEWLITLEPHGFRWSHAHIRGAAAVRGTAQDLALFLYGRKKVDEPGLESIGDESLLAHWSAKAVL